MGFFDTDFAEIPIMSELSLEILYSVVVHGVPERARMGRACAWMDISKNSNTTSLLVEGFGRRNEAPPASEATVELQIPDTVGYACNSRTLFDKTSAAQLQETSVVLAVPKQGNVRVRITSRGVRVPVLSGWVPQPR